MEDERIRRFLDRMDEAISRAVREEIQDHEDRMHVPTRRPRPLGAVPFPDVAIPDTVLAKMVEMLETLETEDFGISIVARVFDYPESVVLRELADYRARLRRYEEGLAEA